MQGRLALLLVAALALGATSAGSHPDSLSQPLRDGCDRSELLLLGEATVDLVHRSTMEVAPEWVYVGAGDGTRTIRTLEGTVLATHTAGSDLFGSHKTYDLNIDVAPDPGYEDLLSTRNDAERPPQIHTEWEPLYVPTWAWPSPNDHVRETGSWIWDCGHWQEGSRRVPGSDAVPGDPLGDAGVEHIGGEEAEIHPISELATWRTPRGFVPPGRHDPTPMSQLDVYISDQGGGAKAVEECALSPANPGEQPKRVTADGGCSELQDVTGRDYTYVVHAPPRPARDAKLRWEEIDRASHNAPAAIVTPSDDSITVKVPFSREKPSSDLQDFGATYRVWWERDNSTVHRFRVSLRRLDIFNNLDKDAGSEQQNPEVGLVSPNGEWNVYLDVSGGWRTLHAEIKRAGIGDLDNVPSSSPAKPTTYDLAKLAASEVDLLDGTNFRMFVDARDCDEPGFVDCPADHELDFSQHPGRAEMVMPVSELVGKTTTFLIHARNCPVSGGCPEEDSDPACKGPCYDLAFTVTDVDARGPTVTQNVTGDGTPGGTTVNGIAATDMPWWVGPLTPVSLDQNEEASFIRKAIEDLRRRS
jgi:hypothetical protein